MDTSYKPITLLSVALILILTVSSRNGFSQQPKLTPPSKAVVPVHLSVTVKDQRGQIVSGLSEHNFEISVDNAPAKIVSFQVEDSPASIGFLFDASRSAGGFTTKESTKNLGVWREALTRFMSLNHQSNEYFLLGFNNRPQLLVDWTSDPKPMVEKLAGLRQAGQTAFYDACYVGIDKVQQGRHSRRALVVISDGLDNNSRYSLAELLEFLKESGVLLYSLHFPLLSEYSSLSIEGERVLSELSSTSGGEFLYNRGEGPLKIKTVNALFEVIATELRNLYSIGIEPSGSSAEVKWHKVKVKVRRPDNAPRAMKQLTARTRSGYYLR